MPVIKIVTRMSNTAYYNIVVSVVPDAAHFGWSLRKVYECLTTIVHLKLISYYIATVIVK